MNEFHDIILSFLTKDEKLSRPTEESFFLPIHYLDEGKKHKLDDTIVDDLELMNAKNTDSIYQKIFEPKTVFGKEYLHMWSKEFASDVVFLKDSQKLLNKFSPEIDSKYDAVGEYSNIHAIWNSIYNDKGFKEKYNYIDIPMLMQLNNYPAVLQVLSLQQLTSPVISLLTPLVLLIIPFILLRIQNIKISTAAYISALKDIAAHHPIGKLFENIKEMSWEKRIYMVMSVSFYFIQIYQNIVSCNRFYKNMFIIHENICKLTQYIHHSTCQMKQLLQITLKFKSFSDFNRVCQTHLATLEGMHEMFRNVQPFKLSLMNLTKIGQHMKYYYDLYSDASMISAMRYTFGFNAYYEHLSTLTILAQTKQISKCSFRRKNTVMKDFYYPLLSDPIKNSIQISKKVTITGPNAAGKTTLIKSILLNIIVSQQFGYGFYKKAIINPYQFLHCYLNIPDTSGRDSLFQAESRRCIDILNCFLSNKDARHFCIFDELYSGTNPYEAVASAYGFITYLTKYSNIDLLLTTHYCQLCKILPSEHVENMHMQIKNEDNDDCEISYLYKLGDGISSVKGGIKVLRDLKYPDEIINSTKTILKTL